MDENLRNDVFGCWEIGGKWHGICCYINMTWFSFFFFFSKSLNLLCIGLWFMRKGLIGENLVGCSANNENCSSILLVAEKPEDVQFINV